MLSILVVLFGASLLFGSNGKPPHAAAQTAGDDRITCAFQAASLPDALEQMSRSCRLRIGVEATTEVNPVEGEPQHFNFANESVSMALSRLIKRFPGHQWRISNNIVNVRPERATASLLDVKIAMLEIPSGTPIAALPNLIAELPEISAHSVQNNIRIRNFAGEPGIRTPRVINRPLVFKETALRDVLNTIITEGDAKFWLYSRYGSGEYALLRIE